MVLYKMRLRLVEVMTVVMKGCGFDEDRHEAVLSAAELGALAVVAAIAKNEEVSLVEPARYGITFKS